MALFRDCFWIAFFAYTNCKLLEVWGPFAVHLFLSHNHRFDAFSILTAQQMFDY